LHGCRQSALEFAEASRLTELAEQHGLILVAPEQGVNDHQMRCWRWYERRNQERDRGEPGLLADLVAEVLGESVRWRADPDQVYAIGLSAGGVMALTLAATYPDVFAAVGAHSAPPHGSAGGILQGLSAMAGRTELPAVDGTSGMAPAIVFHGTDDTVVDPSNTDRVVRQWLDRWTACQEDPDAERKIQHSEHTTGPVRGRSSTVSRWFAGRGPAVLEVWRVHGLGHAWSGGLPEGSYSDPDGPSAGTEMWRFLVRHRLS
jgi:poly(hydroxyalkanoate) depolymerase family esterase